MPWFNNTLKRLCNKKQRLFNKAKRTRKAQHWEQYKSFKKDLLKAIRRQRWCYINDMLQVGLDQGDSKPFWRYVRAQRQDTSGISPLLHQGVLHTDSLRKAKILNNQFMSVFTVEDSSNTTYLYGPDYPHIEDLTISREGVEKCLSNLNITKASGPDSILCRFFLK